MKKRLENYSRYEIDENGNVFSLITKKYLKHRVLNSGYLYVDLYDDKRKVKRFLVHRLVGMLFVSGQSSTKEINHIDKDKFNCNNNNLEWVTTSENSIHKYTTYQYPQGSNNCRSKLTDDIVTKIKFYFNNGIRTCDVSKKLNIHPSTLSEIKQGRTWSHI